MQLHPHAQIESVILISFNFSYSMTDKHAHIISLVVMLAIDQRVPVAVADDYTLTWDQL